MSEKNIYVPLDRAVIEISGKDSSKLLQGIISNDVEKVSLENSIYAYQLTPQGKYLFDYFISKKEKSYLIDIALRQKDIFLKKLKMYKLRSDVEIEDCSNSLEVAALIGPKVFEKIGQDAKPGSVHEFCKGHAYLDPRGKAMHARAIINKDNQYKAFHAQEFEPSNIDEYHSLRVQSTIPEGDFDLIQEKSYPLHFRMIDLNGVDFNKGCYVGQEVTARTHHRGKIRKNVFTVEAENKITSSKNDEIIVDDKAVGSFLTTFGNKALAVLDVEFAEGNTEFEFNSTNYMIDTSKLKRNTA